MSKDKGSASSFAIGAAIGALAGVITGILIAPKSGKETREDIKQTARTVVSRAKEEIDHLEQSVKYTIRDVQPRLKAASDRLKREINAKIEAAKKSMAQVKEVYQAVKDGTATDKDLEEALEKAKEAKQALAEYIKK